MVPGMTERERRTADEQRLAWLADAALGPTRQPTAAVGLARSREFKPQTVCRRLLVLALSLRGLGKRFPSRTAPRVPHAAIEQMTA